MAEEEKNGKFKSQEGVGRKFLKPLSLEEKRESIKFDQSLLELLEKVKLFQNDLELLKKLNKQINRLCHNKVGYLNLEVMLESNRGNYRDAASLYHRPSDLVFLKRCSKEILAEYWRFKGGIFYNLGFYDRAQTCFRKGLELKPASVTLLYNFMEVSKKIDHTVKLTPYLCNIGKLGEFSREDKLAFCNILLLTKADPGKTLNHFKQLKLRDDPNVLIGLGRAYIQVKDYAEARECFKKVFKNYPGNKWAALGIADILRAQNEHEQAIRHYKEILKKHPRCVDTLNGLGLAYRAINNYQEASEAFKTVLGLCANNWVAKKGLKQVDMQASGDIDSLSAQLPTLGLEGSSRSSLSRYSVFSSATLSAEAKKSKNSETITSTRESELQNGSGFTSI